MKKNQGKKKQTESKRGEKTQQGGKGKGYGKVLMGFGGSEGGQLDKLRLLSAQREGGGLEEKRGRRLVPNAEGFEGRSL